MKLNEPRITLLSRAEWLEIEVRDSDSFCTFVRLKLTPEQFTAAMGRLAMIECEWEVYNLDKIGKKWENRHFEFEIPEDLNKYTNPSLDKLNLLCSEAMERECLTDWVSDNSYDYQWSFFTRDGKRFARVTIRRWI